MLKLGAVAAAVIALPMVAYGGMALMTQADPNQGGVHNVSTQGPVSCRIKVTKAGDDMITLVGVVDAKEPVKGSYRMQVKQRSNGGTSDIDQSGDFDAAPGKPGMLNQVRIASSGTEFDAQLTITWPGGKLSCNEASSTAL